MKRMAILLAAGLAHATLFAPHAVADAPAKATGGGTGTFGADLDGDGDIDGSHFGMGVVIHASAASGSFECLMAGNADFLGLPLMAVQGKVTEATADVGGGTASFGGISTVNLGHGQLFKAVPFEVAVSAGGPGVGTLTLTVIGLFDGAPGDTEIGNGNYDLPTESVATGFIVVH